MDEVSRFADAGEHGDPLAAMIGGVAAGSLSANTDRDLLRLSLVRAAQDKGLSWAQIGTALGYPSGRAAKKAVHGLRDRVKREQAMAGLGSRP
jgi:hypothetical protein